MTTNLEEERLLKNNKSCGCQQEVASHEAASFGAMSAWCLCSISQQNYTNFSNSDIETKRSFERLHCFEQKSSLSLSLSLFPAANVEVLKLPSWSMLLPVSMIHFLYVGWMVSTSVLKGCTNAHIHTEFPPPPLPLPTANTAQTKQTFSLSYTHTHTQIHTSMHEH